MSDDFTKIPASSHKMLLQRGIDVQGMLDVGELDLSRDGAAMRSVETHVDGIDPAEPVTTTTTWRDREPVEAIVSTTSELVAKLPPSELLHSSDEVMVYVDAGMDGHLHGVAYRYEGGDRNYTVPPHLDAAFVPRAVRFAKLPASDDESFVYLAAAQRSSMARIASARWARLRDATEIGFDADVPGYQPFWDIVQPDFVEAQLITKTADVTAYAAYGTANPPTQ